MNNSIIFLVNVIPGIFLLMLFIYSMYKSFKNEHYYFVSYSWQTKKQKGHGSIEITLQGEIESYDDIQEIGRYIEENTKDAYGESIHAIILNYNKLSKLSKSPGCNSVFFTKNGVEIKNLKNEINKNNSDSL